MSFAGAPCAAASSPGSSVAAPTAAALARNVRRETQQLHVAENRCALLGAFLVAFFGVVICPSRFFSPTMLHRQRHNWNATSAASMMPAPSPWIGVITSPSSSALRTLANSGSRFMISAVRNAPTRMVDTKMNRKPEVMATLMPTMAIQPVGVCGGCQFNVPSDKATNSAVDDTNEYQVDSRASAPPRKARVSRRMAVRQTAAPSAKATPAKARPAG